MNGDEEDQQMNDQSTVGIFNSADRQKNKQNKKDKPHVTWDEEQLAEHDKTRG